MNWEAIGEMVGATAVVISLVMLTFQVRYSAQTTEESNRLERSAALDRHSDTISRWRGRLSADGELAGIWLTASKDGELDDVEEVRLNNLWIDLVNTQRANFTRARIVGETGLARQAVLSIAVEMGQSRRLRHQWDSMKAWSELTSSEFSSLVDAADVELRGMEDNPYRAGSRYHEFVS